MMFYYLLFSLKKKNDLRLKTEAPGLVEMETGAEKCYRKEIKIHQQQHKDKCCRNKTT